MTIDQETDERNKTKKRKFLTLIRFLINRGRLIKKRMRERDGIPKNFQKNTCLVFPNILIFVHHRAKKEEGERREKEKMSKVKKKEKRKQKRLRKQKHLRSSEGRVLQKFFWRVW